MFRLFCAVCEHPKDLPKEIPSDLCQLLSAAANRECAAKHDNWSYHVSKMQDSFRYIAGGQKGGAKFAPRPLFVAPKKKVPKRKVLKIKKVGAKKPTTTAEANILKETAPAPGSPFQFQFAASTAVTTTPVTTTDANVSKEMTPSSPFQFQFAAPTAVTTTPVTTTDANISKEMAPSSPFQFQFTASTAVTKTPVTTTPATTTPVTTTDANISKEMTPSSPFQFQFAASTAVTTTPLTTTPVTTTPVTTTDANISKEMAPSSPFQFQFTASTPKKEATSTEENEAGAKNESPPSLFGQSPLAKLEVPRSKLIQEFEAACEDLGIDYTELFKNLFSKAGISSQRNDV